MHDEITPKIMWKTFSLLLTLMCICDPFLGYLAQVELLYSDVQHLV